MNPDILISALMGSGATFLLGLAPPGVRSALNRWTRDRRAFPLVKLAVWAARQRYIAVAERFIIDHYWKLAWNAHHNRHRFVLGWDGDSPFVSLAALCCEPEAG